MSHQFDTGMFSQNKPAWHGLGNVIADWPGSWKEARKLGGLDWEPISSPVYEQAAVMNDEGVSVSYSEIGDWHAVTRSDNRDLLSIQQKTYKIITNTAFGEVIEEVMGLTDTNIKFETVCSLYGGRVVLTTVYLDDPVSIDGDPSATYQYLVFISRHDGQGGLRVIFTNVRVVCANTLSMAEQEGNAKGSSYVIRHTENWAARVKDLRNVVTVALANQTAWVELANRLNAKTLPATATKRYLLKFIPESTDMTELQYRNVFRSREEIRAVLNSPTCAEINKTAYGLLMATTEWADHVRRSQTLDAAVSRSLLRSEPYKVRAVRIAKELAGVK